MNRRPEPDLTRYHCRRCGRAYVVTSLALECCTHECKSCHKRHRTAGAALGCCR